MIPRMGEAPVPLDFQSAAHKYTYSTRTADAGWSAAMRSIVDPRAKRVVDVGCGGGIYTRMWTQLGAAGAVGLDSAGPQVEAARELSSGDQRVRYAVGSATATGLDDACADIVFARALIHHGLDLEAFAREVSRVLVPGGILIVQDRTMNDVDIPGSSDHIRGYLFECFPRLLPAEAERRPRGDAVLASIRAAGFAAPRSRTLWEVRQRYDRFEELAADLTARTGRSILHLLSDEEIAKLVAFVRTRLPDGESIIEQDRWTLWFAVKPA